MTFVPFTLSDEERKRLSVLYLAKHAPRDINTAAAFDPNDGVVPVYHHELARVLHHLNIEVTCSRDLEFFLRNGPKFNYVFSIYNRAPFRNSEVFVSALCEYLRLAYLGARPHVRALAEDKHLAKTVATHLGIPTAPWAILSSERKPLKSADFAGPYFLKPRFGAASEEITEDSLQDTWNGVLRVSKKMLERGIDVIVEQFIPGMNITQPILGASPYIVLPCVEDICLSKGGILTYRQNRFLDPGMTRALVENGDLSRKLAAYALSLTKYVEPIDYYRVDYRVTDRMNASFLELNVCCNLGSHSSIAIPAQAIGVSYAQLVEHILTYSLRRQHPFRK